jgi:hypothetical protein
MKRYISIFRDIRQFSLVKVNEADGKPSLTYCLVHAGLLLGLLFKIEYRGDIFIRNICWILTDCTALYSKRYNFHKWNYIEKVQPTPFKARSLLSISFDGDVNYSILGSGFLAMAYRTHNYCDFGLTPWSGILENRKHDVSETGSLCWLGLYLKFLPPFLS